MTPTGVDVAVLLQLGVHRDGVMAFIAGPSGPARGLRPVMHRHDFPLLCLLTSSGQQVNTLLKLTGWRVIRCLSRRYSGDHTWAEKWLPELVLLAWVAADSYVTRHLVPIGWVQLTQWLGCSPYDAP